MSELRVPPAIAKIVPDGNLTPRQTRHFLIEMSRRRVKPGTGSSEEFMLRRTAMYQWPDLRQILSGINWAMIGGVATRAYMPERITKDMDILVYEADGEEAIGRLVKAGYKVVSRLAIPGYLLASSEGVEIDVLFGKYRWLKKAFTELKSDPAGYPVLSLGFLVLLKMEANRGRDVSDLYIMLGWASDKDLDEIRKVVARYSPEDVEDLESLIFIGQKEREMPPSSE